MHTLRKRADETHTHTEKKHTHPSLVVFGRMFVCKVVVGSVCMSCWCGWFATIAGDLFVSLRSCVVFVSIDGRFVHK